MFLPGAVALWVALAGLLGTIFFYAQSIRGDEKARGHARQAYALATFAVLLAAGVMLFLLLSHDFRLAYVYSYSDRSLSVPYLISSLWAGQEGSFLLWLVWGMLVGLPLMAELVRDLGLPVLAHPALGGAQRFAPEALLGTLFPLYGADAVIFPSYGGRFSYGRARCEAIARAVREPRGPVAPALPVPAGGLRPDRVADALRTYGPDTMLLIGGGLIEAQGETRQRCRQFADAVQAFSHSR